jgi:selenocysteine-specific elongation factor
MKHLIMGTAGHIDHGKTALVKALTGIDCDTHKEEKRRGITINLGFAHLALDGNETVGIVDVPGHRDFVHTMVSGASGIDFALLVIAADAGVMPQTREHVHIMELLGIKTGIVALTKIDLIDPSAIAGVRDRIRAFTQGTFLESCPLVNVSPVTSEGVDELKRTIARTALETPQRPGGGVFRMYIDRVFSVSGFGTVVTGSVTSGKLHVDDTAYLLPGSRPLRVRRLERYGEQVNSVSAGDRASCNCAGMNKEDFKRGMLISGRALKGSRLLDATLTLFPEGRDLGIWTHAVFLLGAFESQARVHVLDGNNAVAGGTALVQIHLCDECIALAGDRFVVRSRSGDVTLGGGEIIDPAPLHHRRRPRELVENLSKMAGGGLPGRIAAEVRKNIVAQNAAALAERFNTTKDEIANALHAGIADDIKIVSSSNNTYAIALRTWNIIREKTLSNIRAFHKANSLLNHGRSLEDLIGVIGVVGKTGDDEFPGLFLEALVREGILKKTGNSFALPGHSVSMSRDLLEATQFVEQYFKNSGMQTPLIADLEKQSAAEGIDQKKLKGILGYLTNTGVLYWVEGSYLHAGQVGVCRKKLLNSLKAKPEGLTVAQFRDVVQGNRKICLLLLALFEKEGIVRRSGDVRVLTEAGEKAAGE